jgi:hypothetical protein
MRIVGEIPHPRFKITLMYWNERYMVKFEDIGTELIFKFREGPLMDSVEACKELIDSTFLDEMEQLYGQILKIRVSSIERQEVRKFGT